jgi:hypothetical protein
MFLTNIAEIDIAGTTLRKFQALKKAGIESFCKEPGI